MKKRIIPCLLLLALLMACFAACRGEAPEIASMSSAPETEDIASFTEEANGPVSVNTIDEFLAALNSSTSIYLEEGSYHLNEAKDYGQDSSNPAYYWEPIGDGYQLVLNHLHDLILLGPDRETTCLLTDPRFANVISFVGCKRINLEGFTLGHTEGGALCTGGVLDFSDCQQVRLSQMGLFGCGIRGMNLYGSTDITVDNCHIYDCSLSGIDAQGCRNINILQTDFTTLGTVQEPAMSVFTLDGCESVLIEDCSIQENVVMQLLEVNASPEVDLRNTEFSSNRITAYGFSFQECQPLFDACSFRDNSLRRWYEERSTMAIDPEGLLVGNDQLPPVPELSRDQLPVQQTIHVSTTDEFLAALGSDREIILDAAVLDLSAAGDYSQAPSLFYYWDQAYDGPSLIIANAHNLTIRAEGDDEKAHSITAVPRYANVLSFRQCQNLTLEGFTAGHSEAPGECVGGVLDFEDCDQVTVNRCGLFGCGVLGVRGLFCGSLAIKNCDIYECSFGGISLDNVEGVEIAGNRFRDLGGPNVMVESCSNVQSDVAINDFREAYN